MRKTFAALAAVSTLALAMPAMAQDAQTERRQSTGERLLNALADRLLGDREEEASADQDNDTDTAAEAAVEAEEAVETVRLEDILAAPRRDDDRARDRYRNPAETLAFFQVEPTQTVVEYGPGGGWYTRVLAPYLQSQGTYVAINNDSNARTYSSTEAEARAKGWTSRFKDSVGEMLDVEPESVVAYEIDETPEEMKGTVDRALVFRSMHGLWNNDEADTILGGLRELLADDGMVGVVQHRAPANASWSDVNPARGYMRQQDVIDIFELHGFELVATSEVNANPRDPANWEGGVWTLPPVLRYGEQNRARYLAIGESDRMTLLFKKAD